MAAKTTRPVQLNLEGICRADNKPKPPKRLEKILQAHSLQTMGLMGYSAMETGKGRAKVECNCPKCGATFYQYPKGWQGNTPGFPDVSFFRYSAGFPGVFIQVEMKGEDTPITPEQKSLADNGRSVIAHSIEDVIRGVLAAEEAMHSYQFPDSRRQHMLRFLEQNKGHLG